MADQTLPTSFLTAPPASPNISATTASVAVTQPAPPPSTSVVHYSRERSSIYIAPVIEKDGCFFTEESDG